MGDGVRAHRTTEQPCTHIAENGVHDGGRCIAFCITCVVSWIIFCFHTPPIQFPAKFVPRAIFLYPACLASTSTPAGSKEKHKIVKNLEVDFWDNEIEKDMLKIDVGDARDQMKRWGYARIGLSTMMAQGMGQV